MAAAIENRTADNAWSKATASPASISFRPHAAEAIWRSLEGAQFSTPYQRFDFLAAWHRQVGERDGLAPFIVVGYDADRRPLVLLPLA